MTKMYLNNINHKEIFNSVPKLLTFHLLFHIFNKEFDELIGRVYEINFLRVENIFRLKSFCFVLSMPKRLREFHKIKSLGSNSTIFNILYNFDVAGRRVQDIIGICKALQENLTWQNCFF